MATSSLLLVPNVYPGFCINPVPSNPRTAGGAPLDRPKRDDQLKMIKRANEVFGKYGSTKFKVTLCKRGLYFDLSNPDGTQAVTYEWSRFADFYAIWEEDWKKVVADKAKAKGKPTGGSTGFAGATAASSMPRDVVGELKASLQERLELLRKFGKARADSIVQLKSATEKLQYALDHLGDREIAEAEGRVQKIVKNVRELDDGIRTLQSEIAEIEAGIELFR